jgi:hypothetical protein
VSPERPQAQTTVAATAFADNKAKVDIESVVVNLLSNFITIFL